MERATTTDLLNTIESQKEQLQRYESRLRDVVRAYKGLVKEKEALEASLKVLSHVPDKPQSADDATTSQKAKDEKCNTTTGNVSDVDCLKEQIQTLSSSLATLTEEKSRLEASLIADKKKLLTENEHLQKIMDVEDGNRQSEITELQSQLAETRSKLRSHQLEREAEQTNHGIMLKELQLLLAQERTSTEKLESQLESVQNALKEANRNPTDNEQYEKRITDLLKELNTLQKQLKEADGNKSDAPSPLLLELKRDMEKMKKSYQQQVSEEARRANDAEFRLNVCANQAEERICGLESKLSEISAIIGNYDKLRVKDQEVISRLKERVCQLDNENAALATSASTFPSVDTNLDAQAIAEKIMYLRDLLHAANEKSETPVDMTSLLSAEKSDNHHPHCARYKEELEQTKEEFERYKLRAQSVLKNKHKETSNKELELLKEQVSQMREKIRQLQQEHSEKTEGDRMKIDHLSKTLQSEEQTHRQTLTSLKSQHAKQMKEMEHELKKQRERTVAMLSEKDGEIAALKSSTGHSLELEYLSEMRSSSQSELMEREGLEKESAVSKLLGQSQGAQGETLLLHFAQEQARKDVEIASLRKQKRQMEGTLRDVQHNSTLKQEKLIEDNEKLKEEIWKQERNVTRENANLEYLKNVVFNFLTSSDRQGKKQMLKAIMTILQFSPNEKEKVNSGPYM